MGGYPVALQLYTVRDHMARNVAGTLAKVRDIGYEYVEVADTHGLGYAEFRELLGNAGLKPASLMLGYDVVAGDPAAALDAARAMGVKYVAVPMIDPARTPDKDSWLRCARALDAAGARLREQDVRLCYHNHAHEFQQFDGQYILDLLMGAAPNVEVELDVFWVRYAGLNPVMFLEKYKDRTPLVHVKDMADLRSRAFTEVGQGILAWPEILRAAREAGARWYIVEQDTCAGDSLESAKSSLQFMIAQ